MELIRIISASLGLVFAPHMWGSNIHCIAKRVGTEFYYCTIIIRNQEITVAGRIGVFKIDLSNPESIDILTMWLAAENFMTRASQPLKMKIYACADTLADS